MKTLNIHYTLYTESADVDSFSSCWSHNGCLGLDSFRIHFVILRPSIVIYCLTVIVKK